MKLEQIEKCIKEYGDDIYRFCYFLTGSREAADDLYQESFLVALEKAVTISEEKEKSYLMGIAANIWKNKWRKKKRRSLLADQMHIGEELIADKTDLLQAYVDKEAAELVLSVVNDLPERYRIVVLMYYNGQMTTGQIAEELKISKGTVTSRLMRARDMIKKGLEARGYER